MNRNNRMNYNWNNWRKVALEKCQLKEIVSQCMMKILGKIKVN